MILIFHRGRHHLRNHGFTLQRRPSLFHRQGSRFITWSIPRGWIRRCRFVHIKETTLTRKGPTITMEESMVRRRCCHHNHPVRRRRTVCRWYSSWSMKLGRTHEDLSSNGCHIVTTGSCYYYKAMIPLG